MGRRLNNLFHFFKPLLSLNSIRGFGQIDLKRGLTISGGLYETNILKNEINVHGNIAPN